MSTPDVSVVVAVYNTMPYLTKCLTSLVEQSIGRDRLQVVAVDDGSTDGSGAELDRFAERYPDTVEVIHQPNSGGPAAPSNRALERATGRYVFFLGADDYLGREALERLVSTADELGSDIVLGKLVGANGRVVNQKIFARNRSDVTLFDSPLPWALSNTKLFRRDLIERHHLRFPEHMVVCSDQPFTFEACLRAGRISVLADYDFYHAVRRHDSSNITYNTPHEEHLHSAEVIMDFVAGLVQPGGDRDAILARHFSWELSKLLRDDFLTVDPATQQRVYAGVRRLADRYLTDGIRPGLNSRKRVRLALAQCGRLADLLAAIRQDVEHGGPAMVVDGDRCYASYPGFRDPELSLPDSWFEITREVAKRVARFEVTSVTWDSTRDARSLTVTVRNPVAEFAAVSSASVRMTAGQVSATVLETIPDETGTTVRGRFEVDRLLAGQPTSKQLHRVQLSVTAFGTTRTVAARVPRKLAPRRVVVRRGLRLYIVTATANHNGRLVVATAPVTVRRVIGRLRRHSRQGGNQQP